MEAKRLLLIAIIVASIIPIVNVSAEEGIKGEIEAKAKSLKSNDAIFGATDTSTDGFDKGLDTIAPPPPIGEHIEVYFYHPDWPFVINGRAYGDFMTLDDSIEWPLRVAYMANDNSDVTLKWDIEIDGYNIWLMDNDGNILADMEKDKKYEFAAEANNTYEFKIVAKAEKESDNKEIKDSEYNGINDLLEKIKNRLIDEGFTDDEIDNIISNLLESLSANDNIPEQGAFLFNAKKGSIHALLCILPHDPPLLIGENIQCLVLYMSLGSPVTINDLHVYANAPSSTIPMFDENWAPDTIPDPFIWLSDPITLNEAGEWTIVADFTRDSSIVLTVDVTFNVLPEGMVGAVGLVGASIAALMVYSYRKRVIKS
ncbi:MAG: hypothetical protein KatS3mg003_0719 [Candidatus Nitrosocaldaceae archaeon]|nr:MAG: hypothetical protein KatS3mg003_0719 [Candidatus Nitrosocaldaceae archaeon]